MSADRQMDRDKQVALMKGSAERQKTRVRELLTKPAIADTLRRNHEATQAMKSPPVPKKA